MRYYIRCRACLAVGAVEAESEPRQGACPCGGRVESMGKVHRDRLVREGQESPCDGRCTGAKGPSCDCHCGGVNHGSGRLVAIRYDLGPVPRFELSPDDARAMEYQVALAFAEARIARLNADDVVARKLRGAHLSPDEFRRYRAVGEAHLRLRKVERMRTHHGRIKALRAVGLSLA